MKLNRDINDQMLNINQGRLSEPQMSTRMRWHCWWPRMQMSLTLTVISYQTAQCIHVQSRVATAADIA